MRPPVGAVLQLQQLAGNGAVGDYLALQRCGPVPAAQCPCHADVDGEDRTRNLQRAPAPAQRIERAQPEGPIIQREAAADDRSWGRGPSFGPARAIEEAQAEATVATIVATMGSTATTVIPFPPRAVSSVAAPGDAVQTSPVDALGARRGATTLALQRSGGGGSAHVEGGVVASAQICYDLCSGEVSLVGWLWAGAGVKLWGGWYGAYHFWEGSRKIGELDHLTCGMCSSSCGGAESGKDGDAAQHSGWGLGGFPVVLKPKEWARFKKLGVELGFLVSPHSRCDADLEVIALIDLLEYVPSLKPPLTAAEAACKAIGIDLECGFGIDISGSVHLCRNERGETTADHAKVCGGLFLGCGVGLSHDKSSLRGQHPVPA